MRACRRCGSGRLAADWDGELRCLSCGRTPPADQTPAAVARLTGLSPRTISRWIDAGLLAASPPRGSGRPRLVDTGAVIRLVAERHTLERRCEWCGSAIPQAGVQRASRVTRRWCSGRCKGAHANEMRRQGAARGASVHQGGRNPYRTGPRRGGVVPKPSVGRNGPLWQAVTVRASCSPCAWDLPRAWTTAPPPTSPDLGGLGYPQCRKCCAAIDGRLGSNRWICVCDPPPACVPRLRPGFG